VGGRGFFARTALKSLQRPPPQMPQLVGKGVVAPPQEPYPRSRPCGPRVSALWAKTTRHCFFDNLNTVHLYRPRKR